MHQYETDTVVLGLGAMGSAALYHLALRGIPAIGIEQFAHGHNLGSTHGPTRVFRPFYADPIYVEMARAAEGQWRDLERRAGTSLFTLCGQLVLAHPENEDFQSRLKVLQDTNESYELMTRTQTCHRFPMVQPPADKVGCWIPRAGFLEPIRALTALVDEALKCGSTVLESQKVVGIERQGSHLELTTKDSKVKCQRLICAGGSWTSSLLPSLSLNLQVTRQQKFHFRSSDSKDLKPDKLPVYFDAELGYYGFPVWHGHIERGRRQFGRLCAA